MTFWLALVLMQDPDSQATRARAAMESSIEKQRASVRKQVETVRTAPAAIPVTLWTPAPSHGAACDPVPKPELSIMIDEVAHKESIDPSLVREVARKESGFRPCAVSPKGAEGLMQLMPSTQVQLQVMDPFNAQQSLEAGSKLLKQLLDRYHGDVSLALSAYNAGPNRVDKAGGIPEIPETKNYVLDILNRLIQ